MRSLGLAPMQEGMLFHILGSKSGQRPYHNVIRWELQGDLEVAAYRKAWQEAVAGNDILRTGIRWEGVERPVQVVWDAVETPFEIRDVRGLGSRVQKDLLDRYLAEDLRRGFELEQPPLLRLAVFRLGRRKWEVVLSFQHLILDGWSVSLLLDEMNLRYEAARRGEPALVGKRRPYRDYIRWLQQQDLGSAAKYWRELLAGFEEPTQLPREYSEELGHEVARCHLGSTEVENLKRLARLGRVTLNTVIVGAWGLLLSRYSGAEEVVFGATSSGRPSELKGAEEMLGLFINTLPVRVKVKPDQRLSEWLVDLQEQQVQSRRYEYSPLSKVKTWSQVEPGQELFESIVVFENYPPQEYSGFGDVRVMTIRSAEDTDYPLTVTVEPRGQELDIELSYQRRAFSPALAEQLLGHMARTLEQMAVGGERRLREISLLADDERRQLLVEWNLTEVGYPADKTVHELFEAQVKESPEAIALVCDGRELTYQDLNRRANRLAHRLRETGTGPETLIGICAERSLEMVVGLLGILKAGGAYVPLDPSYPIARLEFILDDTEAPVLLVQQSLLTQVPKHDHIEILEEDRSRYSDQNPAPLARPDNLAYVIYTSGSTGRPKGVMIEHRNIVNLVSWAKEAFTETEVACILASTSINFDLSAFELWASLAVGAKVVLVSDIAKVGDARLPITLVNTVPSAVTVLVSASENLPDLRAVNLAGESLSAGLVRILAARYPQVQIRNLYGPSETTTYSTGALIGDFASESVPIGKPIQNTTVYVLDRWGEVVPVGVQGELFIGGAGVARGYLKQPELTKDRFIDNPFSKGRLYRTGDLVRWLKGGNLEFIGRIDEQVKIRGFRIEPGEIETCVREQAGVKDAVVVAGEDAGRMRLVAYVVGEPGQKLEADQLKEEVRRRLPEYMVPTAWVELKALPLTPNGKLDRHSLPEPERTKAAYDAPRNQLEVDLCQIWADILGLDKIGVTDNFFDLGGDSIHLVLAVTRMQMLLGAKLPIRSVLERPSIRQLTDYWSHVSGNNEPET